jgi:DNA-binding HxlR family transcriptional regulator
MKEPILMKDLLRQIDKALDNKIRFTIMAHLVHKKNATFNEMKALLGATDGNLSSNASILQEKKYIEVNKTFSKKKPLTTYVITDLGKVAFKSHVEALGKIIQGKYDTKA